MGELTVSMLRGEEGRQRKELEKLLHWLETEIRPDIVHLSNVMLCGMARRIRQRLAVPVIATLSGEDIFLEKLPPPYNEAARGASRRAADLDALVAMNRFYADFMSEFLAVPRDRITVIRPGLNLQGHRAAGLSRPPVNRPFTIGFLSRNCPDKGLHLLVEAWKLLALDAELPPVRLRVAGYLDPADRPYLDDLLLRAASSGLGDRFECLGELDRPGKIAFLQSLDLFSVPAVCRESKGLPILEAWANGVPAVLPDHGAFPEMVADTGGGLLCAARRRGFLGGGGQTHDSRSAICRRLRTPVQQAVHHRYHAQRMAEETLDLYRRLLA